MGKKPNQEVQDMTNLILGKVGGRGPGDRQQLAAAKKSERSRSPATKKDSPPVMQDASASAAAPSPSSAPSSPAAASAASASGSPWANSPASTTATSASASPSPSSVFHPGNTCYDSPMKETNSRQLQPGYVAPDQLCLDPLAKDGSPYASMLQQLMDLRTVEQAQLRASTLGTERRARVLELYLHHTLVAIHWQALMLLAEGPAPHTTPPEWIEACFKVVQERWRRDDKHDFISQLKKSSDNTKSALVEFALYLYLALKEDRFQQVCFNRALQSTARSRFRR